jgi:Flp pilus assembly protein TadG
MYKKAINNEKGVALILVAVSVVVLFGMGALAIDVGHLYNVKNQLQSAADAAALAGATEMTGATLADMTDSAFDAADRIARRNVADVSRYGRPIPVILAPETSSWGRNGDSFISTDRPR